MKFPNITPDITFWGRVLLLNRVMEDNLYNLEEVGIYEIREKLNSNNYFCVYFRNSVDFDISSFHR
ncbi:hypothetical protein CON67_30245 [Bacillus toyonensis]|nr:hypothetical protein CON67_30245 [Bacillus toyonensis]